LIYKIVIPVRGDGKGDNVLAHAAALARRFKAHVVITHCRPRAEDMMPYGVPIPASMRKLLLAQTATVADQVEDGLRQEVQVLTKQWGLSLTDAPVYGEPSASWVEEQGRQVDIIKRHGRLADLICVAKPDVDRNLGSNTLKAALFNTGRPVMMCPAAQSPPDVLCDKIAIAWNGSTQASRAVALTLDVIGQASEVVILTTGEQVDGAAAEDLERYLQERGANARIHKFSAKRKIGERLLEAAAEVEADTIIMGAYSNSHERETIFGGTTQVVVDQSTMPVIFVH